MKKGFLFVVTLIFILALTACSSEESIDDKVIKVGASPVPHAEILEFVRDALLEKGYTLEIVEFTDYVLPNLALDNGELDANFFQHVPYLDYFNEENGTTIVSAGTVHFEPLGIYAGTATSLASIEDGASIAIPNDSTNRARALLLLESLELITLDPEAGLSATVLDITSNPYHIDIVELEAAGIPARLADVDFGVINGNYALNADVVDKLLSSESSDSVGALLYANIIAVRQGTEDSPAIVALLEVLQSDAVRAFILEQYNGLVLPVFE